MIEAEVIVPSIKWHDSHSDMGLSLITFLDKATSIGVLVQSIKIEVGTETTATLLKEDSEDIRLPWEENK
jgi:hypothetical protein